MAKQRLDRSSILSAAPRNGAHRKVPQGNTHLLLLLFGLLLCASANPATCEAQVTAHPMHSNSLGISATIGGGNTQFPDYADNAIGFDIGVFYQRSTFLGAELRGGAYPISARYTQAPITLGYRAAKPSEEGHSDLGWSPAAVKHWAPFGYVGAGISYAQDSGANYLNPPASAKVDPCIQVAAGIDRPFKWFTLRIAELSWVETYTSDRPLRTPYLSGGLVYHFRH